MKLYPLLAFAIAATTVASAQNTPDAAAADPQATLQFIHAAWDTLSRSMNDCPSLGDTKVSTDPILYMPADLLVPSDVSELKEKCHVRVRTLPRRIDKLGDVRPGELPADGLLYLPAPYVAPGGQFKEMYEWDSYFILLGLEADHHEALAKDIVDNFLFEIEHYGGVLNTNRTYTLTRSQPPFLTSMIRAVYQNSASFSGGPEGRTRALAWLQHAYDLAGKDYSTWLRPEHLAGSTGLARYFDFGTGPVPEMADDSTYYPDVIRWLLAHPQEGGNGFLLKGSEYPEDAEAARLKQSSCDVKASKVCMRAWASGYRLTRDFFLGDRAMRESGFDPSNRFGPFSGATHHFAPVCLNSLLYRYENDMEHFAHLLNKPQDAARWSRRAQKRLAAMQRYLWQPRLGVFADYDFMHAKASTYAYVSSLYPLWAGVATREQAKQIVGKLDLFERPGGLSMSNTQTGLQWDEPFGWASTNWIGIAGLELAGFHKDAARIAAHFNATVDQGFAQEKAIREKYNVVLQNADVQASTGYKGNEIGAGWTNAIYLKDQEVLSRGATPSAGR